MFEVKFLVRLTIDNYPLTQRDKNRKPFSVVGGKIAIAKLSPKGIEWPEPAFCFPTKTPSGKQ